MWQTYEFYHEKEYLIRLSNLEHIFCIMRLVQQMRLKKCVATTFGNTFFLFHLLAYDAYKICAIIPS